MRVSIIIPSFNQAEYLREAIESALAQSVPCEIICVDDGSTDNSLEIARSYEPKIQVISQSNKGLASARNTGIMNARGDYVLPLDADDVLDPNCVWEILWYAKETGADIIGPSLKTFGLGNETIILKENPTLDDFRLGNYLGYFSAVKKEALLEVGGYSPKMVEGYEDLWLWVCLLSRGKKVVTIPKPLVFYRTKPSSMWHEAKKHHTKLMNQIYADFPNFLPRV